MNYKEMKEIFRAAKSGTLPDDFDLWDLAVCDGWTVAHEAARYGHLPDDFRLWSLTDINGITVRDIAVRRSRNEPGRNK